MGEQRLPGGFVTTVVRVGNTVRRRPPGDPQFVHALLGWFERHGWDGAPRFLGTDERDREVLSFIEDQAAAGDPAMIRLRDSGAAQSVRDAHDWVRSHRAELAARLTLSSVPGLHAGPNARNARFILAIDRV